MIDRQVGSPFNIKNKAMQCQGVKMKKIVKIKNILKGVLVMSILMSIVSIGDSKEPEQPFRVALSVSPFTNTMINQGYTFEDSSGNKARTVSELQQLFMKHGANEVFVRIATDRYSPKRNITDHSLERALERAKMAAELGLPLNPEIGLFEHYADVRGQPSPDFSEYPEIKLPGPWETLTVKEMAVVLKQYGAIVAKELVSTGVRINIWDIGNEIDFGIAGVAPKPFPESFTAELGYNWYRAPDKVNPIIGKQSIYSLLIMNSKSRIKWCKENLWPHQAVLMRAVKEGILLVVPNAKFSTHLSGAGALNPDFAVAFYRAMSEGGFDVDQIGFSFYPSASASSKNRLKAFQSTVKAVHVEFGLPVFIAEFAYPAAPLKTGLFKSWNHQVDKYKLTPEGQAAILHDLTSWGIENGVCGIRYWAPDVIVPGWGGFSLFSVSGIRATARPALDSISRGLADSNPDAPSKEL